MSTSSGLGHNSTAFVGCDHGKVTKVFVIYFKGSTSDLFLHYELHFCLKFVLNWEYHCWISSSIVNRGIHGLEARQKSFYVFVQFVHFHGYCTHCIFCIMKRSSNSNI